jgi:AcrR family transcriptional regulator
MTVRTTYHHGDLREAMISAAVGIVSERGVDGISLRQLARQLGVSHGAPAHHFGDRTGLFTAIAARGFELLYDDLRQRIEKAADNPKARLNASGQGYVLFAVHRSGYFKVMFRAELLDRSDPSFAAASKRAYGLLRDAIVDAGSGRNRNKRDIDLDTLKAWSQAHGLATLWLSGTLGPAQGRDDFERLVAEIFPLEP